MTEYIEVEFKLAWRGTDDVLPAVRDELLAFLVAHPAELNDWDVMLGFLGMTHEVLARGPLERE